MLTREVARLFTGVAQEVITLGTPVVGVPKFTTVGKRYAKGNNIDLEEFELDVHQRNSIGLTQPVTSIYRKSNGVVINNQLAINSITLHLWVTLGIYWYLLVIIIFFNVKDLNY
ncbi:hypothetical protein [Paraglaciecola sp. MB-3u-78]|uniref:hypothetical protein n=1 Tax=Paraglaciecola sp. MB-3u-78 TaxID=2058332 RepID=UPI001E65ACF9|nr:hypothetical protein [Paraglaciecola sp. MB-3u-78]